MLAFRLALLLMFWLAMLVFLSGYSCFLARCACFDLALWLLSISLCLCLISPSLCFYMSQGYTEATDGDGVDNMIESAHLPEIYRVTFNVSKNRLIKRPHGRKAGTKYFTYYVPCPYLFLTPYV